MAVGIDETVAHLRRQRARREARAARRVEGLRALLPGAARLLRDEFGVDAIWLFGSLATGAVHPASDVDLAVRGLPRNRYVDALGALERLFPCTVDLARLEEASPSLVDRVAAEGRAL